MNDNYYVYILTNGKNGTLYVGVTNNLVRRIYEHKSEAADGFTKKYQLKTLVYYEIFNRPETAIHREKCMKRYKREWKTKLISKMNPEWKDLYEEITK